MNIMSKGIKEMLKQIKQKTQRYHLRVIPRRGHKVYFMLYFFENLIY